jgi:hypothetical protein
VKLPASKGKKKFKKKQVSLHVLWTEKIPVTKIQSILFINKGNTQQLLKIENND